MDLWGRANLQADSPFWRAWVGAGREPALSGGPGHARVPRTSGLRRMHLVLPPPYAVCLDLGAGWGGTAFFFLICFLSLPLHPSNKLKGIYMLVGFRL